MKFDLVFSNPPYNANTDIKILNDIIDCADEWVIVHPSTWVLDIKKKTKLFNDFSSKVENNLVSLDFFNGNNIFNIKQFVPCVISHIDFKHKGDIKVNYFNDSYSVSTIEMITKFGSDWESLIKPFYLNISNYINNNSSIWPKRINATDRSIDPDKFYCQLSGIIGNHSKDPNKLQKDDFYSPILKNSEQNKGVRNLNVRNDGFIVFEFNTADQLDNFINYLKSDFARFCLAILKNTQNIHYGEMELIPWLDFNEAWDDDKLFEKFDVSDELQTYIREFLPDYYGIRK